MLKCLLFLFIRRGTILHVDISSNNVVLDKFWNARLIDFGLACELKENQKSKTCTRQYGKDGYCYSSNISKWRTDNDYHNYGVGKWLFNCQ
jgi:serine/threonine protein kinase